MNVSIKVLLLFLVALCVAGCDKTVITSADGEGSASLDKVALVAGDQHDFSIRYTVGPSGIAVGGGIAVGFHHASSWWVQVDRPEERHFATAYHHVENNLEMQWHNHFPIGMFQHHDETYNPDRMFHRVLIAKVTKQPLLEGETVEFKIGANEFGIKVQKFVDADHQFRVSTDADGDGAFRGIDASPKLSVVPTVASALSAIIPSQAIVGEQIPVHVRVEDEYFNLAESYTDTVQITDENGLVVADSVRITGGLGEVKVKLATVGAHRLRLISNTVELGGRSNPIRVFESAQDRHIYWADLHGHTGESDGLGYDANEYFSFGRDVAALDIVALTDHGLPNWEANIAAVKKFYSPGEHVTLLGMEGNSELNPKDHVNLYFRSDSTPEQAIVNQDGEAATYKDFLSHNKINHNSDHPEVLTGPHHSGYERGMFGDPQYPFGHWDSDIARFFEVYSSHGTSEFEGNPRPLRYESADPAKYMQGGLAMGRKFAVIAASDNHDSKPGRSAWGSYPGGLAGIWTSELTRESVWSSIWDYSTYATSADRIYVDFKINNQPMGSTLRVDGEVKITGYIIGKTDNLEVSIVKDNQDSNHYSTTNGVIEFSYGEQIQNDSHFYYLRVTQENGERAWSTPIWVESSK